MYGDFLHINIIIRQFQGEIRNEWQSGPWRYDVIWMENP